jgi:hypothetical protein
MRKAIDSAHYSHFLTSAVAKRGLKEIEAAIRIDRSLFRLWRRNVETSVFIYETIRRPRRVHIPASAVGAAIIQLETIPPSPVSERASKEVMCRSRGRLWRFAGHLSNSLL